MGVTSLDRRTMVPLLARRRADRLTLLALVAAALALALATTGGVLLTSFETVRVPHADGMAHGPHSSTAPGASCCGTQQEASTGFQSKGVQS